MAGWIAPPLYSVYAAGKFGIRGFSEALRRESAPLGVNVSVIYPSGASTEFSSHVGDNAAKRRFKTPAWLSLSAEDVARAVVGVAGARVVSSFSPGGWSSPNSSTPISMAYLTLSRAMPSSPTISPDVTPVSSASPEGHALPLQHFVQASEKTTAPVSFPDVVVLIGLSLCIT